MITSLFTALLSLFYVFITLKVVGQRQKHKVSLGEGPNNELLGPMSAHSNFVAHVPLFLIALFMLEGSGYFPSWVIFILGLAFLVGRTLHYHAVFYNQGPSKLRRQGMLLSLWPLIITALLTLFVWGLHAKNILQGSGNSIYQFSY